MVTDPAFDKIFELAVELSRMGRDGDAERLYKLLIARAPEEPGANPALAFYNLGMLYRRIGRVEEAVDPLRRAAEADPKNPWIRFSLGMVLLSLGKFEEGWAFYDARGELPERRGARPAGVPEWRGEDLAGKSILIVREQGFGDEIQFARFAPMLKRMGASVLLLCAPPLERLFRRSLDVAVQGAEGRTPVPATDYWIEGGSIARWLRIDLATIPATPYLVAPEPRPRTGKALRVGLVTKGRPTHHNDAARSMPEAAAAALRRLPAEVVGLTPEELAVRDFADTADVIASLDLVITVDTAVAHLAGAMGAPCWVMLPFANTDWRWLRERTDSPWYPSIRLYRQPAHGDWTSVTDAVARDLGEFRRALPRESADKVVR